MVKNRLNVLITRQVPDILTGQNGSAIGGLVGALTLLSSIGPSGRKLSRRSSLTARIDSKSEQTCLHSSNNRGPRCPVRHPVKCWSRESIRDCCLKAR